MGREFGPTALNKHIPCKRFRASRSKSCGAMTMILFLLDSPDVGPPQSDLRFGPTLLEKNLWRFEVEKLPDFGDGHKLPVYGDRSQPNFH